MNNIKKLLIVPFFLVLFTPIMLAQTQTGTITGRITDEMVPYSPG